MLGIVENEISGFISPDIDHSKVLNSCFEEAGMWDPGTGKPKQMDIKQHMCGMSHLYCNR